MPIPVILDKAAPYSLGGAHFYADARIPSERCISVSAETSRACPRPIDLHVSADDHRSLLSLSEDEAEALITCLRRAVTLRREADQSIELMAVHDPSTCYAMNLATRKPFA